jgi:hypothetical protein
VDTGNQVSALVYGLIDVVVDAARDRVGRIADTQLNEQAAELNEITKRLAAWAAIIAVPTAVTGFYGQNIPRASAGPAGSSPAAPSCWSWPRSCTGTCAATAGCDTFVRCGCGGDGGSSRAEKRLMGAVW